MSSLCLTIAITNYRENLAQRHPCYLVNQFLKPYIKWTEKLVNTQYRSEFVFLRNISSDKIKM